MGPLDDRPEHRKVSKNWLLILMAIIPVWAVVMFVGWFVISTLVPMLGPDDTNQIADENPTKAIIDFQHRFRR